jgi:hypothetical protein
MEEMTVQAKHETPGWVWPLWGVAAGVLGAVGHVFTTPDLTVEEYQTGSAIIDLIDRTSYHVGVVAGFFAVFCLLVFAAGWRRWAASAASASLAAGVVTLALVASAGAMILGYGMKGSLAVYLPGGIDENSFPADGLYAVFMFVDLGPYMAWWGVAMAAAAIGWLSLRERIVPLWIGVLSVLALLPALGFLFLTGLPGFPGVVGPFWLIITSVGFAVTFRRTAPARSVQPAYSS